jgi:hypothetical protein
MESFVLNLVFPLVLSASAMLFFAGRKYLELYFTNLYKRRHPDDFIY